MNEEPRTADGRRLRHISDDAYVVLVEADGSEASERVSGAAWIAFGGLGNIRFVFNPDTLGNEGMTVLWPTRTCVVKARLFVDGEAAVDIADGWQSLHKRDSYRIDWQNMMDVMA